MKKHILISLIIVCFAGIISAQTKIDTIGINRLNGGLKALSLDTDLVHANWGFCLMDPKTGKVITEYQSQRSLNPASSMKVITTITAINVLGPDFTYSTFIEYDGTIGKDSTLNGNLYIRGTGDPTLGSGRIDTAMTCDSLVQNWAMLIRKKGINHITGNIIADADYFEDYATPGSWNWDDIGQYYGAGPYGLNYNENAYTLYYSTTKSTAKIDSVVPAIEGMTVWSDVTVGGTGDEAYIYGAPDNYYRYVTGTIPANRKQYAVGGSMPDPPLFLALQLKAALEQSGIPVEKQATTIYAMHRANIPVNNERTTLLKFVSPPLSEIIFHTNQKSINLYAETLLKTLGAVELSDGSKSSGIKEVKTFWGDKGIDLNGFNMDDGSGLSRMDVLTTQQMCSFLNYEMKQPTFEVFKKSLPIAGQTGTLKTMADNTAAEGKIFAKSGSMYKVRSYSGYVTTKSGDLLTFCVMVNNYTCSTAEIKSKLEKLMVWMVGL